MTDRHRTRRRVASVSALFIALAVGGAGRIRGQADDLTPFLRRLEQVVLSGDAAAHEALLAESADRDGASRFADVEFPPGLTRVVIHERSREPLFGMVPGEGYRLIVDTFEQAGDRGRAVTWEIDVERVDGASADWRIADEHRISSVEPLYRLSLNAAKRFAAKNLTIVSDDLTLTLPSGSAFVADTDRGVTAMVLIGRGDMRFRPQLEAERGQVRIFGGAETLDTPFDAVYLRMNPADFERLVSPESLAPAPLDARALRRAEDLFREESPKAFGVDLGDLTRESWWALPTEGDLLAEIRTRRFDTLTYARFAKDAEDINLFDRKRHHNIALYRSDGRSDGRSEGTRDQGRPQAGGEDSGEIDVLDYDIDVASTPDRQWIDGRARLALRVRASSLSTITLHLAASLVVQSVVSEEYGRLFAMRVKNQNALVINLPATILRDADLSLTITYAGRIEPLMPDRELAPRQRPGPDPDFALPRLDPSALYSSGSYWYPQPRVPDYATATLRLTVPAGLDCVASGDLAERSPTLVAAKDSAPPRKMYEFHATQPLRYLAFVVGRLPRGPGKLLDFGPDSRRTEAARDGVWYRSLQLAVNAGPRQAERGRAILERAADVAAFYQSILDDAPYPSFTLALLENDLPGGHSPGYFAVVNEVRPGSSMSWRDDPASFPSYPDFFLAHELAHQWWGQAVGWRDYHEQWLSEGFSQYFAALYAQHERGDEVFAEVIRQMRKGALEHSDQGPISLGYRLGHIRGDSRVFRAVLYNKSAIVLHMLRRLVGDDAFFRGVRRFYVESRFRAVGTSDFRAAMEAETDRPLDLFFERWIEGFRLPRITFGYRVESGDAVLRVEQLTEQFDFPLTITLQYADRRSTDVVVPVTSRVVEHRVKLAGALRGVEISKADFSLAEIVRN